MAHVAMVINLASGYTIMAHVAMVINLASGYTIMANVAKVSEDEIKNIVGGKDYGAEGGGGGHLSDG